MEDRENTHTRIYIYIAFTNWYPSIEGELNVAIDLSHVHVQMIQLKANDLKIKSNSEIDCLFHFKKKNGSNSLTLLCRHNSGKYG